MTTMPFTLIVLMLLASVWFFCGFLISVVMQRNERGFTTPSHLLLSVVFCPFMPVVGLILLAAGVMETEAFRRTAEGVTRVMDRKLF